MALADTELSYLRSLVYDSSAIVIEQGKEYLIEARLDPLAKQNGFANLGALVTHLRSNAKNGLHSRVVEAMTTNETSFFRDIVPFDLLRTEIVPRLMESRSAAKRLRIWCGASSTGQEPYTIAMVLKDHFPKLAEWNVSIVATDLNLTVLERARAGIYSTLEVNRGLPATYLVKHFVRDGQSFRLKPEITKMVEFRPLNLTGTFSSIGAADIVFMRNVLIYFDVPTKKAILGRVYDLLPNDGVLFLGGAETTLNLEDRFARLETKSGRGGAYIKADAALKKNPAQPVKQPNEYKPKEELMNILVVDDSKPMRSIVRKALKQAGYNYPVNEAANGKEALASVRSAKPSLVLCDWNMPEMSGFELLQALTSEGLDVPFGFVTSETTDEMRKQALGAGARFLLGKPFTADAILAALRDILPPG